MIFETLAFNKELSIFTSTSVLLKPHYIDTNSIDTTFIYCN